MERRTVLIIGIVVMSLLGCQIETVHRTSENAIPIAMWITMDESEGVEPRAYHMVRSALVDAGLHPVMDEAGVAVPDGEAERAREVLLTDERLAGSDVVVLLAVPAGTGRKTSTGFEVPAVGPPDS